jgi:hypothetical protein
MPRGHQKGQQCKWRELQERRRWGMGGGGRDVIHALVVLGLKLGACKRAFGPGNKKSQFLGRQAGAIACQPIGALNHHRREQPGASAALCSTLRQANSKASRTNIFLVTHGGQRGAWGRGWWVVLVPVVPGASNITEGVDRMQANPNPHQCISSMSCWSQGKAELLCELMSAVFCLVGRGEAGWRRAHSCTLHISAAEFRVRCMGLDVV